jgi:acetyl esterase/lipase
MPSAILLALALAIASTPTAATAGEPRTGEPVRYVDPVFEDVTVTSDVVYGSSEWQDGITRDLHLDLYEPAGDTATDRPVVVWMHGGSFSGGSKTTGGSVGFATDWAERGWVAVSIDYRLADEPLTASSYFTPEGVATIIDAHDDARTAVAWLRANARELRINPEVVVATGYSAGGIMASNLAYLTNRWMGEGTDTDPSHVDAAIPLAGGTLALLVEAGEPPSLMHHGELDTTVPYGIASGLHQALLDAGIDSTLRTYPGLAHGLSSQYDAIRDDSAAWAHDRLLGHPAPLVEDIAPRTVAGPGTVWLGGMHLDVPGNVRVGGDGQVLPSTVGQPDVRQVGVEALPVGFHRLWLSTRGGVVWPGWRTRLAVADPTVLAGTAPFTDVHPSNPFADAVSWAAATGLSNGYADGSFRAAAPTSRQAMVAFLYRMAGAPDGADPDCDAAPFDDVPTSHPFCGEIAWAAGEGVTTGYGDHTFRGSDPLTRQAMAALLHRSSREPGLATPTPPTFGDVPDGHPFAPSIEWLAATGLSTGYDDGTFRPGGPASRLALVAMLSRAYAPGAASPS